MLEILSVIVLTVSSACGIIFMFVKSRQPKITYLSAEALDIKHKEIESIRLDSISRAYTQEDVDRANAQCDELYKLYKIRRK